MILIRVWDGDYRGLIPGHPGEWRKLCVCEDGEEFRTLVEHLGPGLYEAVSGGAQILFSRGRGAACGRWRPLS